MPPSVKAGRWITVRATDAESAQVDDVAGQIAAVYPVVSRADVLRAALRLGLAQLAKKPALALTGARAIG